MENNNKYYTYFQKHCPRSLLDIGANTGQFVTMWKEIFPTCDTLSIEANPFSASKLKKLNFPYLNIGISDKKGQLELITSKRTSKGASFYKEINYNRIDDSKLIKINVDVDTLDNLFFDKNFDIIKIDVQGSELDVIRGGYQVIKKCSFLIVEVSIIPYNENAPLANRIVSEMEKLDFYIDYIINEHYVENKIAQVDLIFKKATNHNFDHLNTKDYRRSLMS